MKKGAIMDDYRYEKLGDTAGSRQVRKVIVAEILELFYGSNMSINQISAKTKISHNTVSKYLGLYLTKRPDESTITLTLQSKV